MSLTIDQLLAEADAEIKGITKQAEKTEEAPSHGSDEEPVKLAHFLEDFADNAPTKQEAPQQKTASPEPAKPEIEDTPIAKLAHAAAILETAARIEEFKKSAAFIKKAREAGHSEDQIAEFLEKQAAMGNKTRMALKGLAGAGLIGGAGVAGHEVGEEKGKKKGRQMGYVEGARDYRDALRRRIQMAYGRQG
jgi:hypothetical protein